MNENNEIKHLSFVKKAMLSIKQSSPENAFYAGLYIIFGITLLIISLVIFLGTLTVTVPKYNTTLSVGSIEQPRYFTPIYASQDMEKIISALLYSGLYKKNITGNYDYDLAEEIIKNEDGTEIKVKLKSDAEFANGRTITSDDVIFTYTLLSDPLVRATDKVRYEGLSFERVDDKTFNIKLKKPFPYIEELLTAGILSADEYKNKPVDNLVLSEVNQYPTESGMYEVSDSTLDGNGKIKSLELVSNSNYVGKRPYIKYININYYSNTSDMIKDVNSGKLDVVFDIDQDSRKQITSKSYKDFTYTLPRIVAIFLNANKKESFAKKDVREELYSAIDRNVFSDIGVATFDMLPGSSQLATTSVTEYATSTFTLTLPDMDRRISVANKIKEMLAQKGIDMTLDIRDQNDLNQNIIRNRDYEALLSTIEIQSPSDLYAFWHSSQRNAPGLNISSYTSKTFDQALETIKTATNKNITDEQLQKIRTEFYDEYPYIPLYTPTRSIVYKNNLNAEIPSSINSSKDLISNINYWWNDTEKVWPIFMNEKIINKIYTLLH